MGPSEFEKVDHNAEADGSKQQGEAVQNQPWAPKKNPSEHVKSQEANLEVSNWLAAQRYTAWEAKGNLDRDTNQAPTSSESGL